MKIEARGKYAGVKIHLEVDDCNLLINLFSNPTPTLFKQAGDLSLRIGKKIAKLKSEYPTLLEARTEEEIKAELENEYESAKQKLDAMKKGKDWKEVKVAK